MNSFDITKIEEDVIKIVKSLKVSDNVFPNRPKSNIHADDFIIVSVSGGIVDRAGYGTCTISISLFAKDNSFFKNGKKLSLMYRKLIENFPAESGRLLFDTEPNIIGDTPDDYGYHARIIDIPTIIKI